MQPNGSGGASGHTFGSHLPLLYATEEHHWWSRGMRALSGVLLDNVALPPGAILEIGCGGGAFLGELRRRWPDRPVMGLDLRGEALTFARQRGGGDLFQASVTHLPVAPACCALVTALDVFDQAGIALADALTTCRGLLQPGGYVLLRVSALPWLSAPHDVAFGTGRRYHAAEIEQALSAAGLAPVRLTYANSLLFPLAVANRLLQRMGLADVEGSFESGGWLDAVCTAALDAEASLLAATDLPIGSSLFCLAQRPMEA